MTLKTVFITGGNSGIGRELALYYAAGGAHVGIVARRKDLSEAVAEECTQAGGTAAIYEADVNDRETLKSAADNFLAKTGSIDLVIANAGVSLGDHLYSGDSKYINHVLSTNITGVTNTIYPFIPAFKEQGYGKIAIIGSMASVRGLPGKGGYSASKRALRVLAESWRVSLKKSGISVVVFSPGFIDTPFVKKNKYPMPFMISARKAASIIIKGIEKGRGHLIFPWQWRILSPLVAAIPERLIGRFVNRDKYEIDRSG